MDKNVFVFTFPVFVTARPYRKTFRGTFGAFLAQTLSIGNWAFTALVTDPIIWIFAPMDEVTTPFPFTNRFIA